MLWITESIKINKFVYCPIKVNLCTSVHLFVLAIALTNESISVNHHLIPPHRDYIHSMNDNVRRLDVYIHTQPPSICHAHLHVPIKLVLKTSFHSDCPIFAVIEGIYKFKQVSLLNRILPNTWQRMSKYLEIYRWLSVLGLVQVSWFSRFSHSRTNHISVYVVRD